MNGSYDLKEKRCAICGKTICTLCPEQWAYKVKVGSKKRTDKTYFCCSWHCLQQMPEKPKRGKQTNTEEIVIPLMRQGKTNQEIARETGLSSAAVYYWRQRFSE